MRRGAPEEPVAGRPLGDLEEGLDDDRARELRAAVLSLAERDGNLPDARARAPGAVREFDLESVAVAPDPVSEEGFEERAGEDSEAARGVGEREAEEHAGVAVPGPGERHP